MVSAAKYVQEPAGLDGVNRSVVTAAASARELSGTRSTVTPALPSGSLALTATSW